MSNARYVAVRIFTGGVIRQMIEIYDRESPEQRQAWRLNQQLYPMQIIGFSDDRAALEHLT